MPEFLAGAFGVPAAWSRIRVRLMAALVLVAACWSSTTASRSRTPRRRARDSPLEDQAMRREDT